MKPRHALALALMLSGCANGGSVMPAAQSGAVNAARPPACAGQRTTKKYGARTAALKRVGGSFCVPEFAGFGGTLQYPRVDRPVQLTIRTSAKNIYGEPELGSGASIVYLNVHFHAGTHFGAKLKSEGGLTAKEFKAGQSYTAFGIVTVGHLSLMFPPCYVVATSGEYGGVVPNVGEILTNTTITGNGFGVIEIYSGMQASNQC